ncbi:hypothetical protein BDD14_6596 [Edaphobacter modestus]|uniref:DUF6984 domain-containing protein n=2 Tax=Edaphobacter modestus TaxID=388466 RepID=A0A4Q7XY33_9BACT|nr:hypothetical protein BDD14_6596 [Edaphobacter modestus]
MSDASQFTSSNPTRPLHYEEQELIRSLVSDILAKPILERTLANCRVVDMQDGGMGSIRFIQPERRVFGRTLVEAQYTDIDGVLVSITVNVDQEDQLFEVDFWKVDFSPLKRYPQPKDLLIKR